MRTRFVHLLVAAGSLMLAACGGEAAPDGSGSRLPHVLAPMDTNDADGAGGLAADGTEPLTGDLDSLDARWAAVPPHPRLPRPDALVYARYRNDAFDFTIAYPDTVFKPHADIGTNRGRAFQNADSTAVVLVYAVEDAGLAQLDEQFQDYLDQPELRITYRVREDDWYVLAGYRGARKFYDKTMLRGGVLKTFQIQYDTTYAPYYDAITATMAASFKG